MAIKEKLLKELEDIKTCIQAKKEKEEYKNNLSTQRDNFEEIINYLSASKNLFFNMQKVDI